MADIRLISNSNLKNEIQVPIRLAPALTVVGPLPLAGSALVKQSNLPAPPANSIAIFWGSAVVAWVPRSGPGLLGWTITIGLAIIPNVCIVNPDLMIFGTYLAK